MKNSPRNSVRSEKRAAILDVTGRSMCTHYRIAAIAALLSAGGCGENIIGPRCAQDDWTFRPTHFDPCDLAPPLGALALTDTDPTGYLYDTTAGTLIDPSGVAIEHTHELHASSPPVRVISVDSFSVAAGVTVRVVGDKVRPPASVLTDPAALCLWPTKRTRDCA